MSTKRHPVTDIIHERIINLLVYALNSGLTLEQIGDMCDLTHTMIIGLLKQPGEPGYRGARISLDTVIKLWTGLGKPLSQLFTDVVNVEPAGKIVDIVKILETDKKVLEFDLKVMNTIFARRAVTPKKLEQIKELMAGTEKLLESVNRALDKLKDYQKSLEAVQQTSQTAPSPEPAPPPQTKTRKRR